MELGPTIKSKCVQGISDLTVIAPIKTGLIDALDSRTYETRLRLLLGGLNAVRMSSEYVAIQPFSDMVERIQGIHSFRLAIQEGQPKNLVLAVAFDSAWEPYMRVIWRDLGPLLDVIFCNCDGYPISREVSFAEYAAWVRQAQVPTEFFYTASPLTVVDFQYVRQAERLGREKPVTPVSDLAATALVADDPEAVAVRTFQSSQMLAVQLGLGALTALYRLADFYPPDGADGDVLLRAAHLGLKELHDLNTKAHFPAGNPIRENFGPQLEWFERQPKVRPVPDADGKGPVLKDIQGGIVTSYNATHGALLLFSFDDVASARAFLAQRLQHGEITPGSCTLSPNDVSMNVAFTSEGLRQLGVSNEKLDAMPQEFREGMAARAGSLGDLRDNHPHNWVLPERNWPSAGSGRVELSMVHMAVLLYRQAPATPGDHAIVGNPAHPLFAAVSQLGDQPGLRLLSLQAMRRNFDPQNLVRDHFGFVDGLSQPEPHDDLAKATAWRNEVRWGELFLGHQNEGDDPQTGDPLLVDGTFLVVRKLRQDVGELDRALKSGSTAVGLSPDELKAKMVGRTVDGVPLAAPGQGTGNNFDYRGDPDGALCPLQSHIRRTNPRTATKAIVPRILRRGMSYGPQWAPPTTINPAVADERGLVFIAYNASIAEQFEVIQRWVSGGNSTRVFSGQSDPLLGVPQPGDPRTFRFQHNGRAMRIDLNGASGRPFVTLEWGAYLFVPSMPALKLLAEGALQPPAPPWSAKDGEPIIKYLQMLDQKDPEGSIIRWKAALEDLSSIVSNTAASIWAAIRNLHGGILRTPYGVLVASDQLVRTVFDDRAGNYSVSGYAHRMDLSFGKIYLGLDAGPEYNRQSSAINASLMTVTEEDAFLAARAVTQGVLGAYIDAAKKQAGAGNPWSLTLDVKTIADGVLAGLCQTWFGIPDAKGFVVSGGFEWNWKASDPPTCPGHFLSPSRYMFQPNPGERASKYGQDHGKALKSAVLKLVQDQRANPAPLPPLAGVIFQTFPNPAEDELLASTIIGVLMGFIPTVHSNLLMSLPQWIVSRSLWDLQEQLMTNIEPDPYLRAVKVLRDPLCRAMQLRPIPETVWRTVVKPHVLGNVALKEGDRIVNAIVSATHERLEVGDIDVEPIFGGNRKNATHHTHACPAYRMGMGVLLGVVTALTESGVMRPTPSPVAVSWGS